MQQPPEVTAEMLEEMQQQPDPQMQEQPTAPTQEPVEEDINQAKKALGLHKTEEQVTLMRQQMEGLVQDGLKQTMATKFPSVPWELAEKEIAKMDAVNPDFAKSMRTTKEGMEMAYKTAQASYQTPNVPDTLTDGESGGGQGEDMSEVVRKGEANDLDLGQYVLDMAKS